MTKFIFIIVFSSIVSIAYSQTQRTIRGEVLNEEKQPIPGLVVMQQGKMTGTVTDIDGRFELNVDKDQIVYVRLSALDLIIYLKYSQTEEFRSVKLSDWKKVRKENKRVSKEWKRLSTD